MNGRRSVGESIPSTRSPCYDQQNPTKKSKSYKYDSYNRADESYEENKYSNFSKYNSPQLKGNWSNHSTFTQVDNCTQRNDERYQKNKTARPKPLQYENHKYYDLVFPKKKNGNSTDIFYRSKYYLEYAEL